MMTEKCYDCGTIETVYGLQEVITEVHVRKNDIRFEMPETDTTEKIWANRGEQLLILKYRGVNRTVRITDYEYPSHTTCVYTAVEIIGEEAWINEHYKQRIL